MFKNFLEKYKPDTNQIKPDANSLKAFVGILPEPLINFWQEYGFGNYGNGLIKIINPGNYLDSLNMWLVRKMI